MFGPEPFLSCLIESSKKLARAGPLKGALMYLSQDVKPKIFPRCEHLKKSLRLFKRVDSALVAVHQCQECGSNCGSVKKSTVKDFERLPPFDAALRERHRQKVNAFYEALRQEWVREQEERTSEFWRRHAEVMRSPEWSAKRLQVLSRCQGVCEGCGVHRASHVHHLTYDRLGNEMLFDLVAVCKPCHDLIHGRDTSPEIVFTRTRERTS